MKTRRAARLAGTVLLALSCSLAKAEAPLSRSDLLQDIRIEQRPGAQVPAELEFRDESNRVVTLGSYFNDKPVILHLVYFECPMLCNIAQDGLIRTLSAMPQEVGKDFVVLTVSFDHRETPRQAALRKRKTLDQYNRSGGSEGWHFLTGAQPSIGRLTDAVGFRFAWDSRAGRYAHAAGVIVLTPQGRVSRYLNGVEFAARDVRLALAESAAGKSTSTTDQVMLLCYQYDPVTGRYGLAIMRALQLAGAVTVLGMIAGFVVLVRKERRMAGRQMASLVSVTSSAVQHDE